MLSNPLIWKVGTIKSGSSLEKLPMGWREEEEGNKFVN